MQFASLMIILHTSIGKHVLKDWFQAWFEGHKHLKTIEFSGGSLSTLPQDLQLGYLTLAGSYLNNLAHIQYGLLLVRPWSQSLLEL